MNKKRQKNQKESILIVSRNFPPLTGGMERLIYNASLELKKDYKVIVVGPKGCSDFVNDANTAFECSNNMIFFLLQSFFISLGLIFSRKISCCLAGSGVTAPVVVVAGWTGRIPSLVYIHGLDVIVQSRLYQLLFVSAIKRATKIVANSRNTAKLAEIKGIDKEKIAILSPGVKIVEGPIEANFREQYGLEGKKVLLSVGRLIPRKGLVEFIQKSLTRIVENCEDCIFVIIGSEANKALKRDRPIRERILEINDSGPLKGHVFMLGTVDEQILLSAYKESDLFIFPVLDVEGDVEGFGMVALEAASFGLPTVAFNAGGVSDAVLDNQTGRLVEQGDYKSYADTILDLLKDNARDKMSAQCREFAQSKSWDQFGENLREIVRTTTEKRQ